MADVPVLRPKGIPTIFGDLEEKCITFLLDTSGSMYSYLEVVKEHLIEVLLTRAFKERGTMFNIMEFSSEVIPWADRMVKCTPQTVTVAGEWVKKLGCKTGTNTLDALLAAFADPTCEAVYLVTDGLPDQLPEEILQHIAIASDGRPVHAVYLAGGIADAHACDFLASLATETAGTFHSISLSNKGCIESVRVVVRSDYAVEPTPTSVHHTTLNNPPMRNVKIYSSSPAFNIPATSIKTTLQNLPKSNTITYVNESEGLHTKTCSVTTAVDHDPVDVKLISVDNIPTRVIRTENVQSRYPDMTWETYRPATRLVRRLLANADNSSVTGGVLLQGMRVLARRDKDGFYCLGFVKQQITANGTFLVEFDKEPSSKAHPVLQETAIYDIISYNDASRHSIAAGDKVLAPQGKLKFRFAPGTVLEGLEGRSSGCAADTESLVVSFFNGKSDKILKQTSIWIPSQLYERIKLEIQMPITARQYLLNNPHYPIMLPPGYTTGQGTGYLSKPGITQDLGYLPGYDPRYESVEKYPVYVPVYQDASPNFGFRMPSIRDSAVKSEDVHRLIPGTSLTKEDLNRKVMQQLMDNKMIARRPKEPRVPKEVEKRASPPQEGILRKSVSFRKEDGELDSGIDSYTAGSGLNYESQSEPESDNDEEDTLIDTGMQTLSLKDSGVGTDYSLLYNYRPDSSMDERPPWQYWSPASKSKRPSSAKKSSKARPFRDTVLSAPAEAKFQPILAEPISATSQAKQQVLLDTIDQEIRTDRAQLEWIQRHPHPPLRLPYDPEVDNGPPNRSGAFNTVDHTVKSDRAHLEWILKQPRPAPPHGTVKQQGAPAHRKIGSRDMVREAKERAYLEYRRNQVMQLEAHFAQLENGARQMKEAKEDRCSASLAVQESLTMRYDTSHLTHTKDAFKITNKTSEPEYNNIDTYADIVPSRSPRFQSPVTERQLPFKERPQAFKERPQEQALTVKDVVFSERMTLTPPLEPKLSDQQTTGQVISPRGQIVTNPYIVNHSYTIIPNSIPHKSEGDVVKMQKNSRSDKIHRSKSTGVKSLQMMSELQKRTKAQKKSAQLTKAESSQMRNQEFENSLLALFENSRSYEHNAEDMLNAMQLVLMNKSSAQRPVLLNPSPPSETPKDRFIQNQSTIGTVQHSEETSSSYATQNHTTTKTVSSQNRPYRQTFYPEKNLMPRSTANIKHPDISQNTVAQKRMSQKQSISEQTVTQNSRSKNSGQASQTVTVTEKSEVCTEVKSAVQTTMGMKAHKAIAPKLPHQKFAADVTRRDVQRQQDSEAKLKSIHNAKRTVSSSIARQQQERSNSEAERNSQRLEGLRMRTQRREEIVAQREKEIQDTIRRRQEIKQQRQDDLTRQHVQKLNEVNDQAASREHQKRNNEIQRREHYYNKEQKNQEAKDLRLAVREQKMHDLRSQVLP